MIAVIIPTYNRANLLRDALDSLVSQTNKRFITVVVDDASTEDIKKVTDLYKDKLQLCYIRKLQNEGPGAARQTGLEWAYSKNIELITFLDADDMLYPCAIERLSYEINHHMGDLVASEIAQNSDKVNGLIDSSNTTWTHGKMYRASFLKRQGIKFSDTLRTNEDLAFNLKVTCSVKDSKYLLLEEPLYLWRHSKSSLTSEESSLRQIIGTDYISAIYEAARMTPDSEKLLVDIFNCYNYYQLMIARRDQIPDETYKKVKYLLNLPLVKRAWHDNKKMQKYLKVIKPAMEYQGKVYWFVFPFVKWIEEFMEE